MTQKRGASVQAGLPDSIQFCCVLARGIPSPDFLYLLSPVAWVEIATFMAHEREIGVSMHSLLWRYLHTSSCSLLASIIV